MSPIDYIRIPLAVLQNQSLSDKQKMLLGLIISFNSNGLMMSNGELGKLLMVSEKTVSNLICGLQKEKLIKIDNPQSRYRKIYFHQKTEVGELTLPSFEGSTSTIQGTTSIFKGTTSTKSWNITKGTKETKGTKIYQAPIGLELSEVFFQSILKRKSDFRKPDLNRWARVFGQMITADGRRPEAVRAVIEFCQSNQFWQNIILSPDKLRKQFDGLELQMTGQAEPQFKLASDEELKELM